MKEPQAFDKFGYPGKWVTLKNGEHLFVRNGESVDTAVMRLRLSRTYSGLPNHIDVIRRAEQAGVKIPMTPEEKIASVHIDFDRDNILPELNESELAKVGAKSNKPIRIKKSIIERNKVYHNDAMIDTNRIIGETLYAPTEVFHGKSNKDYYTFIKPIKLSTRNGKEEYGVVLLDVTDSNETFDVVHWHWINYDSLNSLKPNKKD